MGTHDACGQGADYFGWTRRSRILRNHYHAAAKFANEHCCGGRTGVFSDWELSGCHWRYYVLVWAWDRSSDCCFKWRGHYCGTTGCCFRWHHDWRTCSCLWDSICSCWWTIDFRNWIYFGRRQRTDTHSRSRNNSNDHSDQWPNHHRRTKRPGNRWRYTDYAIQPNHASGHSRRHYILPSWRIYCRDWRQDVHFRTWGSTDHDCDQWPDDQYWTRRDRIQDDDIHGHDIETYRDCSRSDYE